MTSFRMLIAHQTRLGPVFIAQSQDGRFHPVWKGQDLGSYPSAIAAIDDVAGGHTFTPSDGVDLGSLGISGDVGDWLPAGDFT